MLTAAVIGCGAIGTGGTGPIHPEVGIYTHAAAYTACAETQLIAVADADPRRAHEAAARWGGVTAFAEATDLLAAVQPELVSLCTPDSTHAELLEVILRTPGVRGVLAEKPLAMDAVGAAELSRLADAQGVVLAVNYSRRYAPPLAEMARTVRGGALGDWQHVSGFYTKGLFHNGTHWLDLLHMFGGEPVTVRGWQRLRDDHDAGSTTTDPPLEAELVLAGGASARLAALDQRAFTAFELELTGTAGRVRLTSIGHTLQRWTVVDDERYPGYRMLEAAEPTHGVMRDVLLHAVTDLVRCVTDDGEPACGGPDAVRALVVAEAIALSAARDGQSVALKSGKPCR